MGKVSRWVRTTARKKWFESRGYRWHICSWRRLTCYGFILFLLSLRLLKGLKYYHLSSQEIGRNARRRA
jgi:hypothetical protein